MDSTGLSTTSRLGHDIENWALFEPFKITPKLSSDIGLTDPDLAQALAVHHLEIDAAGPRSHNCIKKI
jgi:hypothetical protein